MKKCKKKKQEIEFPVRFIEFLMVPETFGVCLSNSNCQNNNSMRHKSDRINRRQFPCLGFQGTLSPFLQSQCCILVSGTGNLLTINIYPTKESFLVDVKCFTIQDIFFFLIFYFLCDYYFFPGRTFSLFLFLFFCEERQKYFCAPSRNASDTIVSLFSDSRETPYPSLHIEAKRIKSESPPSFRYFSYELIKKHMR